MPIIESVYMSRGRGRIYEETNPCFFGNRSIETSASTSAWTGAGELDARLFGAVVV